MIRFLTIVVLMAIPCQAMSHDLWINHGGFRNGVGKLCCGEGDCFVIAPERVVITAGGYAIVGQTAGADGSVPLEIVPFSEAQPSQDGQFWRCKRPDGSRRCFFAPPSTI